MGIMRGTTFRSWSQTATSPGRGDARVAASTPTSGASASSSTVSAGDEMFLLAVESRNRRFGLERLLAAVNRRMTQQNSRRHLPVTVRHRRW